MLLSAGRLQNRPGSRPIPPRSASQDDRRFPSARFAQDESAWMEMPLLNDLQRTRAPRERRSRRFSKLSIPQVAARQLEVLADAISRYASRLRNQRIAGCRLDAALQSGIPSAEGLCESQNQFRCSELEFMKAIKQFAEQEICRLLCREMWRSERLKPNPGPAGCAGNRILRTGSRGIRAGRHPLCPDGEVGDFPNSLRFMNQICKDWLKPAESCLFNQPQTR